MLCKWLDSDSYKRRPADIFRLLDPFLRCLRGISALCYPKSLARDSPVGSYPSFHILDGAIRRDSPSIYDSAAGHFLGLLLLAFNMELHVVHWHH
jgi:hypothetical protein